MFYSLVGDHDHKPHIMIVSLSPDTMFTIIYPWLGRFLGQFHIAVRAFYPITDTSHYVYVADKLPNVSVNTNNKSTEMFFKTSSAVVFLGSGGWVIVSNSIFNNIATLS